MTQYRDSLHHCKPCKNKWILSMIQENFKKWNQFTVGDCLRFPLNLQWFQVVVPCWAATNACLLTHVRHRDYRKMVLEINFLRLIHPEIILKEITLAHHKENKNQFHKLQGQGPFSQEMTSKMGDDSNADICREAVDYEFLHSGGFSAEFHGWTAKTANIGTAIRQISLSTITFDLEDTIQKSSDHLFWFSIGSNVMDKRSGDGWFIGRIKIFAIRLRKEFSKF